MLLLCPSVPVTVPVIKATRSEGSRWGSCQGEFGAAELWNYRTLEIQSVGTTEIPPLVKTLGFFSINFIHQDRGKNNFKLHDTSIVIMCPHTSQRPCWRMLTYPDEYWRTWTCPDDTWLVATWLVGMFECQTQNFSPMGSPRVSWNCTYTFD